MIRSDDRGKYYNGVWKKMAQDSAHWWGGMKESGSSEILVKPLARRKNEFLLHQLYLSNRTFTQPKPSSSQTSRIGPFDPFRHQSYSCSRQHFFVLSFVLLPCGLQWYDFKEIRSCGILCKCESQFRLYSSNLSSMPVIRSLWRMQPFVLWS